MSPKKSPLDFETYTRKTLFELRYKVNSILATQKEIIKSLEEFKSTRTTEQSSPANLQDDIQFREKFGNLPLKTKEELGIFEEELKNDSFLKFAVTELRKLGGHDVKAIIFNLMPKIITNELAQHYSWIGGKGKAVFSTLLMAKTILEVVRQHQPLATDIDIPLPIKNWLRHAKERAEGCKYQRTNDAIWLKPKVKKISDEQKRRVERERKRKYRERIKLDPIKFEQVKKYDRERKKKEKEEGKIKFIKDLTEREKRQQRKKLRIASSKYKNKIMLQEKAEQFLDTNTPPGSPSGSGLNMAIVSEDRKKQGKRRSRQRREKDKRKIKKLQDSLEKSKKEAEKWKKRFQRLNKTEIINQKTISPGKKVTEIMRAGSKEIRKNLMLGVGLSMQLKENAKNCKTQADKKKLAEHVSGEIIHRKKLKSVLEKEKILSLYYQNDKIINKERKKNRTNVFILKGKILAFFEDAENTCLAPGKRDYVTKKKVQKQKRYLLFSLKELHKRFLEQTKSKISYQSFVKLKPFWVVDRKVDKRDTCVCITHANFKFKLAKLKLLRLIKTTSSLEILKESVCDLRNKSCMYGTCRNCMITIDEKFLNLVNFEDFNTFYYKWASKTELQMSKKGNKVMKVKRTVKEKVLCKASDLLEVTKSDLKCIAVHTFNMQNQHIQFKNIKENLTPEEVLIICDWSENYSCKYSEEVQAIHFGASRNQISLHTGVVYLSNDQKLMFCTVSNSTNHGAVSVWTHLDPLLKILNNKYPSVKILHFFTDGPTSQYRNKTNFYLMCKMSSSYGFKSCSWNFWEAGHGKGPADGIGGLVKRTCDRAVSLGIDITNAEGFLKIVKNLNITTFLIDERDFERIGSEVKGVENKLLPVPGTLKLKSVLWNQDSKPYTIILREQSCSICRVQTTKCTHFPPGVKLSSSWNLMPSTSNLDNTIKADDNTIFSKPTKKDVIDDCDTCSDSSGLNSENSFNNEASNLKLKYGEVYFSSDSSSIEGETISKSAEQETSDFAINNFVIVNYEGTHYPGIITDIKPGSYLISVMEKSKKNWKWPVKPDEIWYKKEEIVQTIKPPVPVCKRGFFHIPGMD